LNAKLGRLYLTVLVIRTVSIVEVGNAKLISYVASKTIDVYRIGKVWDYSIKVVAVSTSGY